MCCDVGVSDDPGSLVLQINVVKLVTAIPVGIPRSDYLINISSQIVLMYKFAVQANDQV